MKTRQIIFSALFLAIVYVQETFLTFIPNIQFTTVLIFAYCTVHSFKVNTVFILCYVILDNLAYGFSLYMIPMFLGWMLIPTMFSLFGKPKTLFKSTLYGTTFSFVYCWLFIPLSVYMYGISVSAYLIADIPFEILFLMSNIVTITLLYDPIVRILRDGGAVTSSGS